jgi:hypothetical protein
MRNVKRLLERHGDLLADVRAHELRARLLGHGTDLDHLLRMAELARTELAPVRPRHEYREQLAAELRRWRKDVPAMAAAGVERSVALGARPRRFTRSWARAAVRRYRWIAALTGSAAVAGVAGLGAVAYLWRQRHARPELRSAQ